jgi:hypothetical protein
VELGRIDTIFTAGALLIAAGAVYAGLALRGMEKDPVRQSRQGR